jgi:hypothetical protein
MDARLGRKVLTHVEAHREHLNMSDWGRETPCGTVACLAGWTLLMSGCTVDAEGLFRYPAGRLVGSVRYTARDLLVLTDDEYWPDEADCSLFCPQPEDEAIARFRALVEAAEGVEAHRG